MDEAFLRAFRERTAELESAQKQLLAFRLESSVRAAFIAELQQSTEEALSRAERAEHQLRLLRLERSHEAGRETSSASHDEEPATASPLHLVATAISALQR